MRRPFDHLLAFAIATAAACAAASVAPAADGPIPLRPLRDAGSRICCANSDLRQRSQAVIRSAGEWRVVWRSLDPSAPGTPPPDVDFDAEMVVVASLGEQRTAGHSVVIASAEVVGQVLRVEVVESSPGPTCITAQVLTRPAAAVALPRFGGEVRFDVRRVARPCD